MPINPLSSPWIAARWPAGLPLLLPALINGAYLLLFAVGVARGRYQYLDYEAWPYSALVTFHAAIALVPFLVLALPEIGRVSEHMREWVAKSDPGRLGAKAWRFVALSGLGALLALLAANATQYTDTSARVMAYADGNPPTLPYDSILPFELEILLRGFLPTDVLATFLEAVIALPPTLLLLLHVTSGRWRLASFLTLFLSLHWGLSKQLLLATFEWPSAAYGTAGLVLMAGGSLPLGAAGLMLAVLLKQNGLFWAAGGAILLMYQLARGQRPSLAEWAYAALCGLVALVNSAGVLQYHFLLRKAEHFESDRMHVVIGEFLRDLSLDFPVFAALALLGLVWYRRHFALILALFALMLAVRSAAGLTGVYYHLFFLPLLVCLAASALAEFLQPELNQGLKMAMLAVLGVLVALTAAHAANQWWRLPFNKISGAMPAILTDLAQTLPERSLIISRNFSLGHYLRKENQAKRFRLWLAPYDPAEIILLPKEVEAGTCIIWFSKGDNVEREDRALGPLGFKPVALRNSVPEWRLLSRNCPLPS
ncbi:MAG: hypothetical protein HZC25_16250 [Rhodospirillales bacterium]|nr:hypothetical protein [Rhodospirillales bacterium]